MRKKNSPAMDYVRKLYAAEDEVLRGIRESLPEKFLDWQVGADEGKLLHLLVRLHCAKNVVEVGALAGYSAVWMARALPQSGKLYTLGKDPEHNALARKNIEASGLSERIMLVEGDARITLDSLSSQGPFDMIFIDADKQSYPAYLDWAEVNIRKGGLIVADNTFLFGTIWENASGDDVSKASWDAMRGFNQRLADAERYDATILPTEEGLSVAIKRF